MSDNLGVCLGQIIAEEFEVRIVKIFESTVQRRVSRGQTATEEILLSVKDRARFQRVSISISCKNGIEITIPFKKQDKVYFTRKDLIGTLVGKNPVGSAPRAKEVNQLLTNKPKAHTT